MRSVAHYLRENAVRRSGELAVVSDRASLSHQEMLQNVSAVSRALTEASAQRAALFAPTSPELLIGHYAGIVANLFTMLLDVTASDDSNKNALEEFRPDTLITTQALWQSHRELLTRTRTISDVVLLPTPGTEAISDDRPSPVEVPCSGAAPRLLVFLAHQTLEDRSTSVLLRFDARSPAHRLKLSQAPLTLPVDTTRRPPCSSISVPRSISQSFPP